MPSISAGFVSAASVSRCTAPVFVNLPVLSCWAAACGSQSSIELANGRQPSPSQYSQTASSGFDEPWLISSSTTRWLCPARASRVGWAM